jgi:serine protease Do
MKKVLIAIIPWLFSFFSYKVMAQEDVISPDNKKESQEIIIRKKGDKDANITIQISGDKVTVNGKPLIEFKDDEITINKRKIIVRDGDRIMFGDGLGELGETLGNLSWDDEMDITKSTAFLGVTTEKTDEGAKITGVSEESAAAKAGLKENDIITKIGDTKIDGPEALYNTISAKKPKDEVKVYYLREGKEKSVKATLQERKNSRKVFSYSGPDGTYKTLTIPPALQKRAFEDQVRSYADAYGRNFNTLPGDNFDFNMNSFPRQKKLGLKIQDTEEGNGVKVLEVADSSAAATAGLKKDDIVTEIGGVKVANTDEVREQLMENSEKSSYNIKARRNGNEMSFEIKIPKKLKTANL